MRTTDTEKHPKAEQREQRETVLFWAGLVIAAAGLLAAFLIEGALYVGFAAAMIGTGIVPFDKLAGVFKR